ncbi:hypothetical protein HPB49_003743 [Dermacentor silvarum]|uniref:Uncharacterized protein n=1 Tax=Dermacentor silvarum TaxID=543639 RepID=A0ACB8CDC5_DERSI|nr:hypothetical protein HPB49_003743 [Dermacentor silvarum]
MLLRVQLRHEVRVVSERLDETEPLNKTRAVSQPALSTVPPVLPRLPADNIKELEAAVRDEYVAATLSISVVLYVSFLVKVAYYMGPLRAVIVRVATLLRFATGATAVECVSCSASIFLGTVEAPLMVSPQIPALTDAQLHCVMTAGFANVAIALLAQYVKFGVSRRNRHCPS